MLQKKNFLKYRPIYAVKVQRSLAPLSWFPGSRKPTAHVHQCCRFQSYAKSRRLHAIANEIYKRNLHCVNHIPGIHDNGPPRTTLWRLTLTAYGLVLVTWPTCSQDMDPIEHNLDDFGNAIINWGNLPLTLHEIAQALTKDSDTLDITP